MATDSPPDSSEPKAAEPVAGTIVGNLGNPIILPKVELDGVAAEGAQQGQMAKIWTKLAITSDDPIFHRIAENLATVVANLAAAAGKPVDIDRTKVLLLVIRPDRSAELWADTAAMAMSIMAKRDMTPGTAVFEQDIADVRAMAFPLVKIGKDDKVICLFRQDWRFALYFDFNPDKNLSVDEFQLALGTLHRSLKYRHIYDAIENPDIFRRLVAAGWFPFTEIITAEFRELIKYCEAGFPLAPLEEKIVAAFDGARLERMLKRWLAKPHFASREALLRSAIKNFIANDPVAVIKTVLTEIEGILNDAHRQTHGAPTNLPKLLEFAANSAELKAGAPHTLLLPQPFAEYLKARTFANFDPKLGTGDAGMRHAVGHGAADPRSYTQVTALQALLTLDQFAFST